MAVSTIISNAAKRAAQRAGNIVGIATPAGRAAQRGAQRTAVTPPTATPPTAPTTRHSTRTFESDVPVGQPTPLPQQEREDARQEWIDQHSGAKVFRTEDEIDASGATDAQKAAAKKALQDGAKGVDPFGFTTGEQIGGINVPRGSTERAEAGAPFVSPQAGAMGRAGALGFNPQTFGSEGGFMTVEDRQIEEIRSVMGEPIMTTSKSGRPVIDTAATHARDNQLKQDLQQIERDKQAKLQQSVQDQKAREQQAAIDTEAPTTKPTSPFTAQKLPSETGQSNTAQINSMLDAARANPVIAGSSYMGMIEGLLSRQSGVDADDIHAQQLLDFYKGDLDFSGATDAVEKSAKEDKRLLQERADKDDEISKRNKEIAEETARINKEMNEFAAQKFEINQKIREEQQREANIEGEIVNRRIANKMGITTDTQGLKWMQDEVRKGRDALTRISEFGDATRGEFALQTTRQYALDMDRALLTYDERQASIDANFGKELREISNTISMDVKERKERKDQIWKNYWDKKSEQDKETRADMRTVFSAMISAEEDYNDRGMKIEESAWSKLDWAISTYGSEVPLGILESIQRDLPSTDISSILGNPTLEQLKMVKSKSGGGSIAGSYDTSATSQGNAFSEITPNQLREAVDRVTLNFGGTGKERDRKRSEYLGRINSGESTASIMASMQDDYWASQKGAPRTAHDGRIDASSSADALKSYIDFYGITTEDDGVLGQYDSRKEAVKSFFKSSSQEYNDLSNYVGNIRARIIKENYGAAVTPQELALAKSYVPDMTDHGAKFITKVHNLKNYNDYLDAKIFSRSVGLPDPTPPTPMEFSGDGMSGTAKYSSDDITSALLE